MPTWREKRDPHLVFVGKAAALGDLRQALVCLLERALRRIDPDHLERARGA
jgi:hypothetical protein